MLTLWWWGQDIIQVICIIIYEVHRASLCHVLGVQKVQHSIYGPVVRDLQYASAIRTSWQRVDFRCVPGHVTCLHLATDQTAAAAVLRHRTPSFVPADRLQTSSSCSYVMACIVML